MKKVLLPLLCIFILMTFCSFFGMFSGTKISEDRKIMSKIIQSLSIKYKKEYGLSFIGLSEAAPEGKYTSIGFWFNSKKIFSKDEGRIILIKCIDEILLAINYYPGFDKYLINYPFTIDNISISIFIQPNDKVVSYPEIAIFSYIKNVLDYDIRSPKNDLKTVSLEKETYDEAKQIVESQMNSQQNQNGY